ANLLPILCIGESEAERTGPNTLAIIAGQLDASMPDGATGDTLVIAYEPIWAIGTGRVPTLDQIIETHDMIRAELAKRFGAEGDKIRILYGGSVKPNNAAEIFTAKNVDGALVGGASLKAADFQPIIDALQAS
ncbi:triose-phosphate isomerase family protein, partial [Tateyamaria sp.]